MKLLYTVILLLGATQFVLAKHLNLTEAEDQFAQYYKNELNSSYLEICVKLKNITELILKDETVQQAGTPSIREFKKNINELQHLYPFYMRFGACELLVSKFANILVGYYKPQVKIYQDSLYVSELLKKLGYDGIRDKYKIEFKKFVMEKFLPKFEVLNNTKVNIDLLKWVNKLKECTEYECYLDDLEKSSRTVFDRILANIFGHIFDAAIIFSHNATTFAKAVVKDPQLLKLSPAVSEQLTQNLQDFVKIYESVEEPQQILYCSGIFNFVLFKFNNDSNVSLQDRQLLSDIFDHHGYIQLGLNRMIKDDEVLEQDNLKEFEHFKASQSGEKIQQFLDAIERLKHSATAQERSEAFKSFQNITLDNFNPPASE